MDAHVIRIGGARQHNLQDLRLTLPRGKLVVITGPSGSGKSSLAFDTLYAEGRRRYVESLSAYARQFVEQFPKPDVDFIEGLSPAIAVEQRTTAANPRSTVATTTEIYDYLRLLYSAVGQPHDPATGRPLRRQTPASIVDELLRLPVGTRLFLLAPIIREQKGEFRDVIEKIRREGFVRVRVDGEILELDSPTPIRLAKTKEHTIEAVIDRLVIKEGLRARLADSVETALRWGRNTLVALIQDPAGENPRETAFSTDFRDPDTGFSLPPLTPKHFSFNSHLGACPVCHGLGNVPEFDGALVVPDTTKTLAEGAVAPWRRGVSPRMKVYYAALLRALAGHFKVRLEEPWFQTPAPFRHALLHGTGDEVVELRMTEGTGKKQTTLRKPFDGVLPQLRNLYETTKSELTRQRLRAYQAPTPCPACHGARLRPEILAVTLTSEVAGDLRAPGGASRPSQAPDIESGADALERRGRGAPPGARRSPATSEAAPRELNLRQFCALDIAGARAFLSGLTFTGTQRAIAAEILREVGSRLEFLSQVGLDYLTLDRESGSLSGGESQRIRLAAQIGSGLAGVLYVLDEPSIGLHQRDNDRLIGTLRHLRDLGNSVIVVEHDEDTIRAADHLLDIGPGAGPRGGKIVAQGTVAEVAAVPNSPTGQYLSGRMTISVPRRRMSPSGWLTVVGARENNLQNVTARFLLGVITCVTGVSGSGKSTLIDDILRRALARHFYRAKDSPGKHDRLDGLEQVDHAITIDQSPIGRSPRSNPATYSGAFGPIRELFSQLPTARVRGYDAGRFSFNVKGGRCENCQGDGAIKVEMQFLADVHVPCEVCEGKRYNRETLEISFKGKNIADVLELSIEEAARFFRAVPAIADRLDALEAVGLGYLKLGQSADTLSGGEAQRVKLAAELAKKATGRTVYLFDEPTTGLHWVDIQKLLEVFYKLRAAGNTLIVIEHNLEVIKCADWVMDLGPEGGAGGGRIVAEGTPETVAANPASHTGRYLAGKL